MKENKMGNEEWMILWSCYCLLLFRKKWRQKNERSARRALWEAISNKKKLLKVQIWWQIWNGRQTRNTHSIRKRKMSNTIWMQFCILIKEIIGVRDNEITIMLAFQLTPGQRVRFKLFFFLSEIALSFKCDSSAIVSHVTAHHQTDR